MPGQSSIPQAFSMIGGDDDHGILSKPCRLEGVQNSTDVLVSIGDPGVIEIPSELHLIFFQGAGRLPRNIKVEMFQDGVTVIAIETRIIENNQALKVL